MLLMGSYVKRIIWIFKNSNKKSFNFILDFNLIKDFWTWKTITSKVVHFSKDYAKDIFNKELFMIKKILDSNLLPTIK
jgi:hypothetical protein